MVYAFQWLQELSSSGIHPPQLILVQQLAFTFHFPTSPPNLNLPSFCQWLQQQLCHYVYFGASVDVLINFRRLQYPVYHAYIHVIWGSSRVCTNGELVTPQSDDVLPTLSVWHIALTSRWIEQDLTDVCGYDTWKWIFLIVIILYRSRHRFTGIWRLQGEWMTAK